MTDPDPYAVEIVRMLLAERRRLKREAASLNDRAIAEKAEVPLDYVRAIAEETKWRSPNE